MCVCVCVCVYGVGGCVRACVFACVRACERACEHEQRRVRAFECLRACVRAFVCAQKGTRGRKRQAEQMDRAGVYIYIILYYIILCGRMMREGVGGSETAKRAAEAGSNVTADTG